MHPSKVANVLNLDGQARHDYFVRKVADSQAIWGLEKSGWAMAEDDNGVKVVPFWPEEDFAKMCATGTWKSYAPRKIDLEAFLTRWLPGMQRDGTKVAVFPKPDSQGVIVEPERLRETLVAEASQYE